MSEISDLKEKLVSSNQQCDMQVVKSIENLGSTIKNSLVQKDFSAVPKNTLKLIEEAENN